LCMKHGAKVKKCKKDAQI